MTRYRRLSARLRNRFLRPRKKTASISREVLADVRAFLAERRARTDHWFFTTRVGITLAVVGYLTLDAQPWGSGLQTGMPLLLGYLFTNLIGYTLSIQRQFQQTRWLFAFLDVSFFLGVYYAVDVAAGAAAQPLLAGFFTLLLVAYALYSDPKLSGMLALFVLGCTAFTFWREFALFAPQATARTTSLGLMRMLLTAGFLALLCLATYLLSFSLRSLVLSYSVEFQKRSRAAMITAVERARRAKLEELNQLKRDFISVLSHELRTPLTPLRSSLELIRDILPPHAESADLADIALSSTVRLQRLVNDYTQLAELLTLESNSLLRWNVRISDLVDVLLDVPRQHEFVCQRLNEMVVATDPRLLGGALLALLRRAELLTPAEQPITISGYARDQSVIVMVHDPTSFVEEEALMTLDDPFALSSDRTYFSPNTGIELILAQHSIRRVGGNLRIESYAASGTKVYCTLPSMQPGTPWLNIEQLRLELEATGF